MSRLALIRQRAERGRVPLRQPRSLPRCWCGTKLRSSFERRTKECAFHYRSKHAAHVHDGIPRGRP